MTHVTVQPETTWQAVFELIFSKIVSISSIEKTFLIMLEKQITATGQDQHQVNGFFDHIISSLRDFNN